VFNSRVSANLYKQCVSSFTAKTLTLLQCVLQRAHSTSPTKLKAFVVERITKVGSLGDLI
jgi:hypothetical protein